MIFVATLHARTEAVDEVRGILEDLARRTAAEDGALGYEVLEETGGTGRFVLVERYRDQTAFDAHMASDYVQGALARFAGLLAEPPATGIFTQAARLDRKPAA